MHRDLEKVGLADGHFMEKGTLFVSFGNPLKHLPKQIHKYVPPLPPRVSAVSCSALAVEGPTEQTHPHAHIHTGKQRLRVIAVRKCGRKCALVDSSPAANAFIVEDYAASA